MLVAAQPKTTESIIQYPWQTVERADRAMRCAPFRLHLYATMQQQSVPLASIAGTAGMQNRHTTKPVSERSAENSLLWLIQVGLLRREVDGQGITDSFRLTPLGRQLVEKWQTTGGELPTANWGDRLLNAFSRWFRWPV